MTDYTSMLCVGGPVGGQRYADSALSGFNVPILPRTPAVVLGPEAIEPVKVEYVHYRAETFNTPAGSVSFWVPDGQRPIETIRLLLKVYEDQTR